jgi:hypothetical protein
MLAAAYQHRLISVPARQRKVTLATLLTGLLSAIAILSVWIFWNKQRRHCPDPA